MSTAAPASGKPQGASSQKFTGKRKFDGNGSAAGGSSTSHSHKPADKKFKGGHGGHAAGASDKKKPWVKKEWKKDGAGGSTKKPLVLTREEREARKKERKAAKPNADLIAEANKIWQTSFTTMPQSERTQLIASLLAQMSGKMQEIGLKHDASRAIQLAIKYATEAQKATILKELSGTLKSLSETHFGHYIVLKLLANDTKRGEAKKQCLKEFKTHINKLSMLPDPAKVLDFLFASSPRKDQNAILQEFYSPEFVVFGEDETTKEKSLAEIIEIKPEKKNQMLENLRKYLDKALEKNMIMFRFIHALLLQYLTHASLNDDTNKDFLANLYQYIPALHHSVDGCRIICHMLSVGQSAKERKNILKYFKGLVGNMAERQEGVWVLTCALDVVDDTVLLEKVIFAELLPTLKDQLAHPASSKIYAHVLNANDAALFAPGEKQNYSVSGKWILSANSSENQPTMLSKKDPAIKRLELLNAFLLPLLQTLATLPDTLAALVRSNVGHHLVLEAVKEAWRLTHDEEALAAAAAAPATQPAAGKKGKKGGKQQDGAKADEAAGESKEAEGEDATPAPAAGGSRFPSALAQKLPQLTQQLTFIFDALVAECASPFDPSAKGDAMGAKSNPMEDRFGHYLVKRLLQMEPTPDVFVQKLLDALQSQLSAMAVTNRPAFVLASILEKNLPTHAERLRADLKPSLKSIIAAAQSKPVAPPKPDEDESMEPSEGGKKGKFVKKNAPVYNAYSTTNAGVELLAKLLQGLPTGKQANGNGVAAAAANEPAVTATPAKAKASKAAPKSTAKKGGKKAAAAAAEEAMEVDGETKEEEAPAAVTKTPAKAAAKKPATAKKSTRKTRATANADDMEE